MLKIKRQSPWLIQARLRQFFGSFRTCSSGNIGLLTAFMLVPIVGVSGYAVDHLMVASKRSQLESAADAASLAALKAAMASMKGAVAGGATPDFAAAAKKAANAVFLGNSSGLVGSTPPKVEITKNGLEFSIRLVWSANVAAVFGPIFGQKTYNIAGVSTGKASLPAYVKVYVMVDISQSMGIGATEDDQKRLFNLSNCALSCHFGGAANSSYMRARAQNPKINTRIDVVRKALQSVAAQAKTHAVLPNQIKLGIFTFSNKVDTLVDINNSAQATNFNEISTKLESMTLSTDGGGSNFHAAFSFLDSNVTPGGDGASESSPLVFVLFMTDGVENSTLHNVATGRWRSDPGLDGKIIEPHSTLNEGGQSSYIIVNGVKQVDSGYMGAADPLMCDTLKRKGVSLMPLEIEYVIPIPQYRKKGDGEEDLRFPWIKATLKRSIWSNGRQLSLLGSRLEACASSPADFFSASSDTEIGRAIDAMFARALATPARLTN